MNIYVGNLPRGASENDVRAVFEAFGEVARVNLIKDKFTGDPRGFGFVEMSSNDDAQRAIAELNGSDMHGRKLTVNEARPREAGGGGGGGGRSGGGGGGFNRGGGGGRGGDRGGRGGGGGGRW